MIKFKLGVDYILNSVPLDSGYDNWRSYEQQHVRVIGINHLGMVKLKPTYGRMPIGPGCAPVLSDKLFAKNKVGMW